jgi:hypothetical protein
MGGSSSKEATSPTVAETAKEIASAVSSEPSWFTKNLGSTSLFSLIGSALLFVVGGLILGDVISVDQSAKSGAVAGLFIGASLLLVLGGTSRGAVSTPGEEGVASRFFRFFPPITGSLTNGFRILYYFLPYALFIAGALIDITTTRIQFFPAGITGFVAVLVNYLASTFIKGPVTDRDMCGIPGLSALGSDIMPQSAVFNLTTLSYIASYITIKQGIFGVNKIWPAWGVYAAVALINSLVIGMSGCYPDGMAFAQKIIAALVYSTGAGAIGAWVASERLPSSSDPGSASSSGSSIPVAPGAGTCSAPNDQDQFVCEAYKNGQLVTSTIVG